MATKKEIKDFYTVIKKAWEAEVLLDELSEAEDSDINNEILLQKSFNAEERLSSLLTNILTSSRDDIIVETLSLIDENNEFDLYDYANQEIMFNTQCSMDNKKSMVYEYRLIPVIMPTKHITLSDATVKAIKKEIKKSYMWEIKKIHVNSRLVTPQEIFSLGYSEIYQANTKDFKFITENNSKPTILNDFVNVYGLRFVEIKIESKMGLDNSAINMAEVEDNVEYEKVIEEYINNIHEIFNKEFDSLCVVEQIGNVYESKVRGVRINEIFTSQMKIKEQLQLNGFDEVDKAMYISSHGTRGDIENGEDDMVTEVRISVLDSDKNKLIAGYTVELNEYFDEELVSDIIVNIASFLSVSSVYNYDTDRVITNIPVNMYYNSKKFEILEF